MYDDREDRLLRGEIVTEAKEDESEGLRRTRTDQPAVAKRPSPHATASSSSGYGSNGQIKKVIIHLRVYSSRNDGTGCRS